MLLYGASGHAKVLIDALKCNNEEIELLFDDDRDVTDLLNYKVDSYDKNKYAEKELIVAIGNNRIRKKIVSIIKHRFGIIKCKFAIVSESSFIGEGSVILHGAIIQPFTQIGKHVIINTNSSVDHDCIINDFVHIAPGVAIAGGVSVGEGTLIGVGASVVPNVKIGNWCTIGAGSVVVNDLPDMAVAVGNPARIIKYNTIL